MIPQLQINDRVVVSKLSYHLHNPRRGDIVVFACPPRADCSTRMGPTNPIAHGARFLGEKIGVVQPSTDDYIKRVIALPGETVEGHDGHVYVNGHLLIEPYLRASVVTSDFAPRMIAAGRLWVLGDNRTNSSDSRVFGPIERRTVVGRTIGRVWPLPDAAFL
jgi:signal peptidase I